MDPLTSSSVTLRVERSIRALPASTQPLPRESRTLPESDTSSLGEIDHHAVRSRVDPLDLGAHATRSPCPAHPRGLVVSDFDLGTEDREIPILASTLPSSVAVPLSKSTSSFSALMSSVLAFDDGEGEGVGVGVRWVEATSGREDDDAKRCGGADFLGLSKESHVESLACWTLRAGPAFTNERFQ